MLDCIIATLFTIETMLTIMVVIHIVSESALLDFIKKLFVGRNAFGIFLGVIVFILLIPAFLIILLLEAASYLLFLFSTIWKLGDKNHEQKRKGKIKLTFFQRKHISLNSSRENDYNALREDWNNIGEEIKESASKIEL